MYRLFDEFAHRYDLHTPPGHYQHDEVTVIREALRVAPVRCQLLDVGCGTGAFLERAITAGIDGYGIDASPTMVQIARERVGTERVYVQRMQDISDKKRYDVISSLSWVIHYCTSLNELDNTVARCYRALRDGGLLILQVGNDEQMMGDVKIDMEKGPSGEPDNTMFLYQFVPVRDNEHRVFAQYVYVSRAHRELVSERHELRFCNPGSVSVSLSKAGFCRVDIVNAHTISPFVIGIV